MNLPLKAPDEGQEQHFAVRIEAVFDRSFAHSYNTVLRGGYPEPLYQPAGPGGAAGCIQYREDYFASALHEVAHWCIAGAERRLSVDYGYWYTPDGRDGCTQQAFEEVECKPQALEWIFAKACGYPFKISLDNLASDSGKIPDTMPFKKRILAQVNLWQRGELPTRAADFYAALCGEFQHEPQREDTLAHIEFSLAELD